MTEPEARPVRYPHQIVVRLTAKQRDVLASIAEEQDRSVAQTVRRAVDAYIQGEWR